MLGGGTWLVQNKVLNGAYINFASVSRATATLSDRGVAALPMLLDWGADDAVFKIENDEFQTESLSMLGHAYTDDEMRPLRELFLHAKTVYFYRLNGGGTKATCNLSTALYTGTFGNSIKHVIAKNIDDETKFDVETYAGVELVDTQQVATTATTSDLADNKFVKWKKDIALEEIAGISLANGADGDVTGADHQKALDLLEGFAFNTIGCMSDESTVKQLYKAYTRRMRDEVGAKFQLVGYNLGGDYEGVIDVCSKVSDEGADAFALVPWVLGAECACEINKDLTNSKYDGEYTVITELTQSQLKDCIKGGKFVFHNVGDEVRILDDINSFVSVTDDKNEDFKSNQTIRVIDNWANDLALIFNTQYLGNVPNDGLGRASLWRNICKYAEQLQDLRAIQEFAEEDVIVEKGESKNAVLVTATINIVGVMKKLYMMTYIK